VKRASEVRGLCEREKSREVGNAMIGSESKVSYTAQSTARMRIERTSLW